MFSVIDASALVELLLRGPAAEAVGKAVHDRELTAPAIVDAEVLLALRGLDRGGLLSAERADVAIRRLRTAPVQRMPVPPLLPVAWSLRRNLSAYDALYVALAAMFACPLITTDARLGGVPGLPAEVMVVG